MKRALLLPWLLLLSLIPLLRADTVVTFNEVMYHPATNEPALEWVELRNQMAVDVDISNWSIQGGIQYRFASNTIVRGGGYLVVSIAPDVLKPLLGTTNIWGPFTGRLNNGGEQLQLLNNSGRVVDELNYGVEGDWPVGADGSGFSLAKRDGETASAPPGNWTVSTQVGGTPGAVNFILSTTSDVSLITLEQAWRAETTGVDPPSTWRQQGFNDASWANRPSLTNRSITSLFNTGLNTNRVVLASGQRDPHYELLTSAQGGPLPTNPIVMLNNAAWLANSASSAWIGVTNSGALNVNAGNYDFRTTFSLDGFFSDTAQVNLSVAVDNELSNVLLNGNDAGINYAGFSGLSTPFPLTTGFQPGVNTLEFRTVNVGTTPNPGGFRVVATGTALAPNTNSPLAAGRTTYYFRKSFQFSGNPAFAQLRLRTMVADGAVFYLNGTEVYRQNLPSGAIDATTPALADVVLPTLGAPVFVSASSLVSGANVLAVEVHQAAGSPDSALVGAELTFTPLSVPEITLAFNEAAPATNQNFFVELINYGTNTIALSDYVIVQDGVTNQTLALGQSLAPGGLLAVSNAFGGMFAPGDRLFLQPATRARVLDGIVLKRTLRGRSPDGSGVWLFPSRPTPGTSNAFSFRTEIVINEIMYHHQRLPSTSNMPPTESSEAWLELYNRSTTPVDLTGWEIDGGVSYRFSAGRTLAPGSYLVVAEDAAALRADYPSADIVGNLAGRLSGRGERLVLRDPAGNPADEVQYRDRAPWPQYADGGGSSLELRDPLADNTRPEAWADSDESHKTEWQTFTYRSTAATPPGLGVPDPSQHKEFDFGLLGAGECYIDDLSVVESPTNNPIQLIANGNFENGLTGWRVLGTHVRSRVEEDPDNPGNHVLHLIASGPQEHMHNHIEQTLISNRLVVVTREYQISYRARWAAGNNFLNTRLYFNRAPRTAVLPVPVKNGTPGGPNSRRVPNLGPTFSGFKHRRVIPQPSEPVTVSVVATDPQGVSAAQVFWSANGAAWASAAMTAQGGGLYTGTVPGFPAGTIVQFYVRAVDGAGAASIYPAAGPDSGALYTVADGQANLNLGHNLRLVLTKANADLMHAPTNVMSNDRIPGTLIYDENRPYYNVGIRLKGSEHGRYHDNRASWFLEFPSEDPFRGVHPFMLIDRSGAGDTADNRQSEILVKHILLRAGNIPSTQSDISRVIAPRALHTGASIFTPRHEDQFMETAFENGGEGTMWELELIYVLVGTNAFGYKIPAPDVVFGTDIQNLRDDKEFYRYNFILKNHRDADDYSQFITLSKTFSIPAGPVLDAQVPQVMDIDEWTRTFALEALCGIGDTYTFGNNHNLFMYARPSDGRFVAFSVDMDFAFSQDPSGSPLIGNQNLGTIFNRPAFRRMLYANVQDIIANSFNSAYMTYWVPHYQSFAPGQNYSGIISYINSRVTRANSEITSAGGNVVFNVTSSANVTTNNNLITITGVGPVSVRTIRINGRDYPIVWNTISGWTIRVPVSAAITKLEVQPIDSRGNVISNLVKTVNVNYTGPALDPDNSIVFNEIMYNPTAPDAAYVELLNTATNQSFDLSGWRINGLDFTFPNGSLITNRALLVLAASRSSYARAYGTNALASFAEFPGNLQNDGETLTLLRPGPTPGEEIVVDKVRYEGAAPWPTSANGAGGALQLIDPAQDNSRVANWSDGSGWQFYSFRGVAGASPPPTNLLVFLASAGDVYIDKLWLTAGSEAEVGDNLLANASFEEGVAPWNIAGNHSASAVVDNVAFDGTHSLHVSATAAGSTVDAVAQALAEALVTTGTYTFSFHYLPSTNGAGLRFRVTSNFSTGNGQVSYRPILSTPGLPNTGAGTLAPFPPVWLNELQPENTAGPTDNMGEREPWLELYNSGTTPISLAGYYLANNYSNLTQWAFPPGATLQPGEFKLVFADGEPGETTANIWHTSFRLSPGTGSVALAWSPGAVQILDYLNYNAVPAGRSYGDYPDGQVFERQEFYAVTPGATNNNAAPPLSVRINEWMADNTRTLLNTNNSNRYDDWVELYNPSATPANLAGHYLTDNLANKFQFKIPVGYVIPPGGYLLVWADNQPGANVVYDQDLHTNFRLDQDGEQFGLFASDGTMVDGITFEPQFADISQGRVPNGTGPSYFLATPTPRGPNSTWANRYPTLSPIPDALIFREQLLSFTAMATDPDSPLQTISFTLDDGAPAGATINPSSGLFRWTGPNTASTNSVTVRVTDSGVPALSAARTFQIVVATNFQVAGVVRQPNGDVQLTIGSIPGKTYRVEYKNDLNAANWTAITPDRLATSTSLIVIDPAVPGAQRFYRVQQLD